MANIKAVLFDYGNVLCQPQQQSDLDQMAECLQAPIDALTAAYWNFRDDFDIGAFRGVHYWTKIAETCKLTASGEQLLRLIELDNLGWTRPNPVMAEWANRLRSNGIATAIVSNMPFDIREYLPSVPWLPEFDHYAFSCDLRSMKPDLFIYEHTLAALNVKPQEALFIDDRHVNVEAAKKLGLDGFVFSDAEGLHAYASSIGLPELRFD
ncbi:MAG TPA: HAD family phosphatase [Oculatellaceae cyanobacterium]